MASRREIYLLNEIEFRNELIEEHNKRVAAAGQVLQQIVDDDSPDIGVEGLALKAIDILNGDEIS